VRREVIVMYAKSMVHNAPLLGEAARRWEFVSPPIKEPSEQGPGPRDLAARLQGS
jgi:hypothetical protein